MKYELLDRSEGSINPRPYLDDLLVIASELPPGARAFATDVAHFDYTKFRVPAVDLPEGTALCTKDLLMSAARLLDGPGSITLELEFVFPGHDVGVVDLRLNYEGVCELLVQELQEIRDPGVLLGSTRLGRWLVDEITPSTRGARHEIAFEDGDLVVDCTDFVARWR